MRKQKNARSGEMCGGECTISRKRKARACGAFLGALEREGPPLLTTRRSDAPFFPVKSRFLPVERAYCPSHLGAVPRVMSFRVSVLCDLERCAFSDVVRVVDASREFGDSSGEGDAPVAVSGVWRVDLHGIEEGFGGSDDWLGKLQEPQH